MREASISMDLLVKLESVYVGTLRLGPERSLVAKYRILGDNQGNYAREDCTRETETLSEAKIQILRVG